MLWIGQLVLFHQNADQLRQGGDLLILHADDCQQFENDKKKKHADADQRKRGVLNPQPLQAGGWTMTITTTAGPVTAANQWSQILTYTLKPSDVGKQCTFLVYDNGDIGCEGFKVTLKIVP